jgi:hypothetical protein
MSYGMMMKNPASSLVLSSDGFGLFYAGKATFLDAPTYTNDESDQVEMDYGPATAKIAYRRYTFTSSLPCMFAVDISSGRAAIVSSVKSGTTYTIVAVHSTGTPDARGMYTQSDIEIYAFARINGSPSGTNGLALWDASGTLAWDFSGSRRPLFLTASVSFGVGVTSMPMPAGFTKPAVLGPIGVIKNSVPNLVSSPTGRYRLDGKIGCFAISGSNITRPDDVYRSGPTFDFFAATPFSLQRTLATTAYLFEANGL